MRLLSLEVPEAGATGYQNLMRQNPKLTRSDATKYRSPPVQQGWSCRGRQQLVRLLLSSCTVFLRASRPTIQTSRNGQRRSPVESTGLLYIANVNTKEIITALDAEIARLQHARSLMASSGEPKRRGRPAKATSAISAPKKRKLSSEARKKIAAAQKKRWAKQKAAKTVQVTRVPAKKQPEKRVRAVKKGTAQNALSSRSETVATTAKR